MLMLADVLVTLGEGNSEGCLSEWIHFVQQSYQDIHTSCKTCIVQYVHGRETFSTCILGDVYHRNVHIFTKGFVNLTYC